MTVFVESIEKSINKWRAIDIQTSSLRRKILKHCAMCYRASDRQIEGLGVLSYIKDGNYGYNCRWCELYATNLCGHNNTIHKNIDLLTAALVTQIETLINQMHNLSNEEKKKLPFDLTKTTKQVLDGLFTLEDDRE